jgi:hypothetical protein
MTTTKCEYKIMDVSYKAWSVGPFYVYKEFNGWRVIHRASDKLVKLQISKRRWAIALAKHLSHYNLWDFNTADEWRGKYLHTAISLKLSVMMSKFLAGLDRYETATVKK